MAYADGDITQKKSSQAAPLESCGIAAAADAIGDRWTLLILREALYGVTKFDAMQTELGIPRTVLSGRLKKLCELGVLTVRPYQEPGQRKRHKYVLTAKGVELALPMIALMKWGDKYIRKEASAVEVVERNTGSPCHIGLVSDEGAPVEIGAAQFRVKN